jgi:hypothetical protein
MSNEEKIQDMLQLLAWAYLKLERIAFQKQEDALKLDEIKLHLMGAYN